MTDEEILTVVKFVRDHQPCWERSSLDEDFRKHVYNRRNQLLPSSQKFHDEETLWYVERVKEYLNGTLMICLNGTLVVNQKV